MVVLWLIYMMLQLILIGKKDSNVIGGFYWATIINNLFMWKWLNIAARLLENKQIVVMDCILPMTHLIAHSLFLSIYNFFNMTCFSLGPKTVTKPIDEHIAMTLIDIYYRPCLYCSFTSPLENIRKLVLWVRGCLEQYPAFICIVSENPVFCTFWIDKKLLWKEKVGQKKFSEF